MERIVIEVDEATAMKWRKVPARLKTRLQKSFEKQIDLISQSDKESRFENLLKMAREESAKNGLTEEILQQLLN